ncbi:winged helix-turn-helix transcriptional regulator [Maribacter sp. MJ134]|uniref:Lrp/AsnC family transcriptional regulator n=1 Tax=Maribacter sp. MJ134 TaxID=2496865 RepID=UPI000F82780F|nr:Lrp/AsnC ligand binding domain-containing protein [Maribacter sp. MJ134]AZQ59288.1 winged helix-turn-helix transcriptional regulator [Maribacter sp. MJ134]
MKNKLDQVDFNILSILAEDAQTPYTEVAKTLIISPGTVHTRIKKMREMGLILGASLNLDYTVMGWNFTAFLGIYLTKITLYKQVIENLIKIREVVKVHHVTGKYDIFIKMHTRDSIHYREIYQDAILTVEGIKGVDSFISVEQNLTRHIDLSG